MQQISYGLGISQFLVFLLQLSLHLVDLGLQMPSITAEVASIEPEENAEDRQQQHDHDRREGKPARTQTAYCVPLRRPAFNTGFRGNGAEQSLARARRGLRAGG